MTKIGVLGVGSLAEYLIRGAQGSPYDFIVSPRGVERAAGREHERRDAE